MAKVEGTGKDSLYRDEVRRHERSYRRFVSFTHSSTKAAAVMLLAAVVALAIANSSWYEPFRAFWDTEVGIRFGDAASSMKLSEIVNDILMAIFFLLVGLEIKYEMTVGELTNIRQAILPILAALGGVLAPIAIYMLFNGGNPETVRGWGVPTATDIAFALGILSLLGSRVPSGVRVFLSTLAVADDIIAIVIIAVFYGHAPKLVWLLAAVVVLVVLIGMNHMHIYSLGGYLLVGALLWFCVFQSGIHATIAGVLLAFTIPSGSRVDLKTFSDWSQVRTQRAAQTLEPDEPVIGQRDYLRQVAALSTVASQVVPPATRLEKALYPWVYFVVMPLFALTNADVCLAGVTPGALVTDPVFLGVCLGLIAGKPIGIMAMSLIVVKTGLATLPQDVNWKHMLGAAILGGVGFTMAIFVSNLAFEDPAHIVAAKTAILCASAIAGTAGFLFLAAQARLAARAGKAFAKVSGDALFAQTADAEELREAELHAEELREAELHTEERHGKGADGSGGAGSGGMSAVGKSAGAADGRVGKRADRVTFVEVRERIVQTRLANIEFGKVMEKLYKESAGEDAAEDGRVRQVFGEAGAADADVSNVFGVSGARDAVGSSEACVPEMPAASAVPDARAADSSVATDAVHAGRTQDAGEAMRHSVRLTVRTMRPKSADSAQDQKKDTSKG